MLGLESKQMPLRTFDRFYEPPVRSKSGEGIKIFPSLCTHTRNPLTPKGQLPSILSYVSGLKAAKHLPRRVISSKDYYQPLAKCSRRDRHSLNPENASLDGSVSAKNSIRLDTIYSSHPNNQSVIEVLSRKERDQRVLKREKEKLRKRGESLQRREMRLSFYNTIDKSSYFVGRFREDSSLTARGSNNYQNMMQRAIESERIMTLLGQSKQRQKEGHINH